MMRRACGRSLSWNPVGRDPTPLQIGHVFFMYRVYRSVLTFVNAAFISIVDGEPVRTKSNMQLDALKPGDCYIVEWAAWDVQTYRVVENRDKHIVFHRWIAIQRKWSAWTGVQRKSAMKLVTAKPCEVDASRVRGAKRRDRPERRSPARAVTDLERPER